MITNALGDKGEKTLWGKPSPWCDFTGDVPKAGLRGIAIFDNPANLRYPTSWHVRDYGLMGANCFGYSHFSKEAYNKGLIPENGDYLLAYFAKAKRDDAIEHAVLLANGHKSADAVLKSLDDLSKTAQRV